MKSRDPPSRTMKKHHTSSTRRVLTGPFEVLCRRNSPRLPQLTHTLAIPGGGRPSYPTGAVMHLRQQRGKECPRTGRAKLAPLKRSSPHLHGLLPPASAHFPPFLEHFHLQDPSISVCRLWLAPLICSPPPEFQSFGGRKKYGNIRR